MVADRSLEEELIKGIRSNGPIPFSVFMERALYDDEFGFYSAGIGRAGRRGDFITSVEVGPLFGAVLARALDAWWEEAGSPPRFVLVEVGAGVGTLAIAIRNAKPRCLPALVHVLVERSPVLREVQQQYLQPVALTEPVASYDQLEPGVYSAAEVATRPFAGVILANELLDNLAFDLVYFDGEAWQERLVGVETDTNRTELLALVDQPASPEVVSELETMVPNPEAGCGVPWQANARQMVTQLLGSLLAGRMVTFDYGTATTAELATRGWGWLRVYQQQSEGHHPLDQPGSADITSDVAFDQLPNDSQTPMQLETQIEFLRRFGIDELVEEGRAIWREHAAAPNLAAIAGRSRVSEAEALLDPEGLGAFLVAEWQVS